MARSHTVPSQRNVVPRGHISDVLIVTPAQGREGGTRQSLFSILACDVSSHHSLILPWSLSLPYQLIPSSLLHTDHPCHHHFFLRLQSLKLSLFLSTPDSPEPVVNNTRILAYLPSSRLFFSSPQAVRLLSDSSGQSITTSIHSYNILAPGLDYVPGCHPYRTPLSKSDLLLLRHL